MHNAESNFSNLVIEYLGKIETDFEKNLACLSGAWMGSNHEKNGDRKSRDTLTPFNLNFSYINQLSLHFTFVFFKLLFFLLLGKTNCLNIILQFFVLI